jgi:chromosome condensin MukBEF MukE localization factor
MTGKNRERHKLQAAIDRWGAALQQGDDEEVDRLVRQSRADRVEAAMSGQLGTMVVSTDPAATMSRAVA